jgi:hypothetical protein
MDILSLEYDETQHGIKTWLEEHYKLRGLTPVSDLQFEVIQLEEHYKLK